MAYSKIKAVKDLELPNPPLPGPTQHQAVEKNRDKEGGFAKTLAEKFPFGLMLNKVLKEDPSTLRFSWGERNYQFIEDMLQTNEKMHRLYLNWSNESQKEQRLLNRQIQKDLEEQWFYYLQDHHRFLLDIEKQRDLSKGKWVKDLLNERVFENTVERRDEFIKKIIEAQEIHKIDRQLLEADIKKNLYDNRLNFPEEPSIVEIERVKNAEDSEKIWELRTQYQQNEDLWVKSQKERLETIMKIHEQHYGYIDKYEKVLVDARPDHAKYGWRNIEDLRFGKINPGVSPINKTRN